MSISRRLSRRRANVTLDNVDHHHFSDGATLRNRQRLLRENCGTEEGRRQLEDRLLPWIADPKNLNAAYEYLAKVGGDAPGPDGVTYSDLSTHDKWTLLNTIRNTVLDGSYRPSDGKRLRIEKGNGGYRTLVVQSIPDRITIRAIQQILQPFLVCRLNSAQCGYLATGSRDHLLATVEHFTNHGRLLHTVTNDITDAFDNIPQQRLIQLLPRLIGSTPVFGLLRRITETNSAKGIPQGSPLSPVLLDAYLDHFLFRRWLTRMPSVPLLRYADDILILCPTQDEAVAASHLLATLIADAGLNPKYAPEAAIGRLAAPSTVDWLGLTLSIHSQTLSITPAGSAWHQLRDRLAECHDEPCVAIAARQVVLGWYGQLGPCYGYLDEATTFDRVKSLASDLAIEELPTRRELRLHWQRSFASWLRLRTGVSR